MKIFARLLPLLGSLADALARGDHEQRQVIAPAVVGIQNVVAQAQAVFAALPAEVERVDRRCAAGREQVDRVAVALGFEELPHRACTFMNCAASCFTSSILWNSSSAFGSRSASSFSKLPL